MHRSRKLQTITKTPYLKDSRSFKVIDVDTPEKPVSSACYDQPHVICIYNRFYARRTNSDKITTFRVVPFFDTLIRVISLHSMAWSFLTKKLESLAVAYSEGVRGCEPHEAALSKRRQKDMHATVFYNNNNNNAINFLLSVLRSRGSLKINYEIQRWVWSSVRAVSGRQTVVQQNSIEALHQNRNPLK